MSGLHSPSAQGAHVGMREVREESLFEDNNSSPSVPAHSDRPAPPHPTRRQTCSGLGRVLGVVEDKHVSADCLGGNQKGVLRRQQGGACAHALVSAAVQRSRGRQHILSSARLRPQRCPAPCNPSCRRRCCCCDPTAAAAATAAAALGPRASPQPTAHQPTATATAHSPLPAGSSARG